MNKKHKHAEVIKAWADGAVIEWRTGFGDDWRIDCADLPAFDNDNFEFRVKTVEIPEGFIPFDNSYSIPFRPDLKGYEFLLGDGAMEFRESGTGIPYHTTIIAFRPVPNKVIRWQWIFQTPISGKFGITDYFYATIEDAQEEVDDAGRWKVIGKAEWTRVEFDK